MLPIPVPAFPPCHIVPCQELRGAWVHVHALAPGGFAGSGSPCEELPSQQPAHLQRGIRRRTILISVFLPDFGSLPALAAVPAPWEIKLRWLSTPPYLPAGGRTLSPGAFGAVGTDVSPPLAGDLEGGEMLLMEGTALEPPPRHKAF